LPSPVLALALITGPVRSILMPPTPAVLMPPLRATIPDGYGETGFQATGLSFPTEGRWEIVARVGTAHTFRLVAEVRPASALPLATPPATATPG
jgi:hypothetical protein